VGVEIHCRSPCTVGAFVFWPRLHSCPPPKARSCLCPCEVVAHCNCCSQGTAVVVDGVANTTAILATLLYVVGIGCATVGIGNLSGYTQLLCKSLQAAIFHLPPCQSCKNHFLRSLNWLSGGLNWLSGIGKQPCTVYRLRYLSDPIGMIYSGLLSQQDLSSLSRALTQREIPAKAILYV
jgi:hypothetical protein